MRLPSDLAVGFKQQVEEWEQQTAMRYVTSVEQIAKQEGLQEGLQEGRQEASLDEARLTVLENLEAQVGTRSRGS